MPPDAIYVGRTAGHSAWANPFKIGGYFRLGDSDPRAFLRMAWMQTFRDPPEVGFTRIVDQQMATDWFRLLYADHHPARLARLRKELAGKNLACWCRLCPEHAAGKLLGVVCAACAPCHADVLLELANA